MIARGEINKYERYFKLSNWAAVDSKFLAEIYKRSFTHCIKPSKADPDEEDKELLYLWVQKISIRAIT